MAYAAMPGISSGAISRYAPSQAWSPTGDTGASRRIRGSIVDAFYAAALTNGGTGNGAPGVRPEYHATYYAAFVLDPDGNRLEVVCHRA